MPLSVFHRGVPGFVVRDVGELPPHEDDEHAGAGKGEPEGAGHAEVAGDGPPMAAPIKAAVDTKGC